MKIFAAALLLSLSAFAQNTSVMRMDSEPYSDVSSRGFRIGIVKPNLEFQTEGNTFKSTFDVDETIGFSIGYAYLPILSLGVTTNLTYLDLHDGGSYLGMARLDLNAALALTSFLNIKAGINGSKFANKDHNDIDDDAKPALGYQGSLGLQITPHIGLDLGYVKMAQKLNDDNNDVDFTQSGFEAGLNATF